MIKRMFEIKPDQWIDAAKIDRMFLDTLYTEDDEAVKELRKEFMGNFRATFFDRPRKKQYFYFIGSGNNSEWGPFFDTKEEAKEWLLENSDFLLK